jgi:UDP-N-acetylmuramoyl-tripeptide--D-alanyl-D-alanine ligase
MPYSVRDLPALLRTPIGRAKLRTAAYCRTWPLLSRVANGYRLGLVRNTRVVAVVGSFGKTTTTRAVTAALGRTPHPRSDYNFSSYLAEAVLRIRPADRHAVIEAGISAAGQMRDYARLLRPDVTVVTSIGSEHNRRLGTLEMTRSEKAEMVRALPRSGLAVLNGDDPNVRWMKGQTRAAVRTFGFHECSDVRAAAVALDGPRGTRFTLHVDGQTRNVRIRLLGQHQVYAILAAVAVALAEGFSLDQVLPSLEALGPTPGRLEVVPLQNGALLLRDDFKSPVETIDAALDVLADIPAERRIVVLGEVSEPPGSQGPIYRRLGERVGQIAARAIFVGGSFQKYAAGARRAGLPRDALVNAGTNVASVVEVVRGDLRPGDVVLIKGRDLQRLERIAFALEGRNVRCQIDACHALTGCARCPMLERGWDGLRVVT